jgi:hypothetical protein
MMIPSNIAQILVLLAASVASADHDERGGLHRDGHNDYTFVADDLVWLTFVVVAVVLVVWACCAAYPETSASPPCRQCHSACDSIVHVKIDDPCRRQYWVKHNPSLTNMQRSFEDGDPNAPHHPETRPGSGCN